MKVQITYGDILHNRYRSGYDCPLANSLRRLLVKDYVISVIGVQVLCANYPVINVTGIKKDKGSNVESVNRVFHYNGTLWNVNVYHELLEKAFSDNLEDVAIELELTEQFRDEFNVWQYKEMIRSDGVN